ncbi:MAG TPA: ATP-binding protein [Bryobacteraceae bacterium]|nr:ATP-binding protein [Bryobacteraceae bacterium]
MTWKQRLIQSRRFFRTLRFRVASTFLLLLMIVLVLVGFIATKTLQSILETQSEEELHEQMGSLKGYLHVGGGGYSWERDPSDPEEEAAIGALKTVYEIADDQGNAKDGAPSDAELFTRQAILEDMAQMAVTRQPVIRTVVGADHIPYQILSSISIDPDTGRKWYLAEGRSLAEDRALVRKFERNFLLFLPIALFACVAVSWYTTGAALKALHSVQKAAEEITGTNLGLQIAKRGAEDELDRLIDSFNAMSGRLKASFDQIRQFSTDVSHELRTPLTAIQGQLEVALFTATRKEELQEAVENALQDVERLANLVRALLMLSQAESGRSTLNKTSVDLTQIVDDLVEQFQIPAEAEGVRLTNTKSAPALCEVDRTQIERVVTNLLANAIKYTQKGGWVRASAERVGQAVRLVVEDSGVGIPPTHLPHIFDRFYRVPDANPEKGLGLGLSFVAAIVKAHCGEIHVDSQPGAGSRFTVTLPVGNVVTPMEAAVLSGGSSSR